MTNFGDLEWVVGRYTGTRAKSVIAQGHAGVGYSIIEEGRNGGELWVTAAFRRPVERPLPSHLIEIIDPVVIDRLEDKMFPMNKRARNA